jgi:lipoprotein NlpI
MIQTLSAFVMTVPHLLGVATQENVLDSVQHSEAKTESAVLVAWFVQDISESVVEWRVKSNKKHRRIHAELAAERDPKRAKKQKMKRQKRSAAQNKKLTLLMDKELRKRAEREYAHRHRSSKYK